HAGRRRTGGAFRVRSSPRRYHQKRSTRGSTTATRAARQSARLVASGGGALPPRPPIRSIHAAVTEREQPRDQTDDGGRHAADITGKIVPARERRVRLIGELVDLGLVHQQEERVEPAVDLVVASVELRLLIAGGLERRQALVGDGMQVFD